MIDGSNKFEQAYFLTQHALEFSELFTFTLRNIFKADKLGFGVAVGMKGNLARIAQKIEENGNPYTIADMVRGMVYVDELKQAK